MRFSAEAGFWGGLKAYCSALLFTQYISTFALTTGDSMLPNILPGRIARVDRLHRFPLRRNDFVMFASPRTPGMYSAKRVVGLPGDWVLTNPADGNSDVIEVPEGRVWVLGDNAAASYDSRYFGPLPISLVEGRLGGHHKRSGT